MSLRVGAVVPSVTAGLAVVMTVGLALLTTVCSAVVPWSLAPLLLVSPV